MSEFLISALPTIVILGVLIFVHELGHFIACRLTGVYVEKFSIGFGPELFAWQGKQTRYSISLIPFGGYVKPQGESEEEVKKQGEMKKGDFLAATPLSRLLIIVAGVAMNYLLAFILFAGVFMIGRPMVGTTIAGFIEGYPAQMSGLQAGDQVKAINQVPVSNWQDLLYEISKTNDSGQPITFSVARGGAVAAIAVIPKIEEGKDMFGATRKVAKVGIKPDAEKMIVERYNFIQSLKAAYQLEWRLTKLTYEALGKLVLGQLSFKTISGPIGIAAMAGSAVKMGVVAVLQFTAILSVSLAVVNLLPIPALDGGHFLFLVIEILTGKKVSTSFQDRVTQIGFFLLMALMVLVIINDLANIGFFEKVKEFFMAKWPSFPNW